MLKASKHEAPLKIRSPHRVVADDDVDRLQVHGRQRPQPSNTNHPNPFRGAIPPLLLRIRAGCAFVKRAAVMESIAAARRRDDKLRHTLGCVVFK